MTNLVALPRALLDGLAAEARSAAWFANLGEPPSDEDRAEAKSYAERLALGPLELACVRDWPAAETTMKAPDWTTAWWDREEALRRSLLAKAGERFPERVLWAGLTELTTEVGDFVHAKAAAAAGRMGGAATASIHVAAGAAAHAVYQLALARLAKDGASPFESKFRMFEDGRWPLGVVGSRLVVF